MTTNPRTANHEVATFGRTATVHYAADSIRRPYHVLACNGRSIEGAGAALGSTTGVTCRTCLAGVASGRIVIETAETVR